MEGNAIYKHTFSLSNIGKYYLSPYCCCTYYLDKMYLWREDADAYAVLHGNKDLCKKIAGLLQEGLEEFELKEELDKMFMIQDMTVDEWIGMCVRGGILE